MEGKKTLRQKVYEELREEIISGDIFPGQSLTLKGLSQQYGVSIVPVREALFQLTAEGAIVQRNNRDFRVSTLTPERFEEIYEIRNINELHIAEQSLIHQPPEAKSELESVLERMKKNLDSPKTYIRCNRDFHFTLYSYGRMPMMMTIISELWARIGPYLSIHIEKLENLNDSYRFHESILNSYLDKDVDAFLGHLKNDLDNSHKMLKPLVVKLNISGDTDIRHHLISNKLL